MEKTHMKLCLSVTSVSDIITNSSSEVFLRVMTQNENLHEAIRELLLSLFPGSDRELEPTIYSEIDVREDYPFRVVLSLPYGIEATEFYEVGMEAVMEKYFGDKDYIIEYQ